MGGRLLDSHDEIHGPLGRLLGFFLHNKLVVLILAVLIVGMGLVYAPFDWSLGPAIGQDPVPVDAIPDLGENQQIVFTEWPGGSPQDVDEQLTYPLTTALLGMKGVRSIRSTSMFGFSSIYVIFEEGMDFYESRTRLLERLDSLQEGKDYPAGTQPRLGPDATALGQVFWYTLEGRDPDGRLTGGWDLEELRAIQDWYVRYGLASAGGVSEVASIGGFVREYQVDVDPDAMRHYGVTLQDVYRAVERSNIDVSAKTVELNQVEYFVRGIGFIKRVEDLQQAVVKVVDNVPIHLEQVASVELGPAPRRGALDKEGAEAVGGVVVARFGANPLKVISAIKDKIAQISAGLDRKVLIDSGKATREDVRAFAEAHGFSAYDGQRLNQPAWLAHLEGTPRADWPAWATVSQVTVVPFYDRTGLILQTLGTLEEALRNEMLVTFIVVVLMVLHLRSSVLIGAMLPLAVAMTFIAMRLFGVDANIVALSGIAIAIGTIVDMGIVLCENVLRHMDEAGPGVPRLEIIHRAASEVGGAILAAVLTTIIGFLPVFALAGKAGKLFRPLAFTKTFALAGAIFVALVILPAAAWLMFRRRRPGAGAAPTRFRRIVRVCLYTATVAAALVILTRYWLPLGPGRWWVMGGFARNLVFVAVLICGLVLLFRLFQWGYPTILAWCLRHKALFLSLPAVLLVAALLIWVGFDTIAGPPARATRTAEALQRTNLWTWGTEAFPGLGREFMPPLDEGGFLWMPTISVHGSIASALQTLSEQDQAIRAIPEVQTVVGKIGRADSAIDPAPLTMIETVITYKPEYRREGDRLVRQWRDHIRTPNDIWDEIVQAAKTPGATVAPKLQPIETRLVMLQTGMTARIGVKVRAETLEDLERSADRIGDALARAPGVRPETINVDRVIGKPYLVVDATSEKARAAMRRYGLNPKDVLDVVQTAIGGTRITTTVEGRQRHAVRVRYPRELRGDIEAMERILIPGATGEQVPLTELASFQYVHGPQSIKSEDAFKVAYVTFDTAPGLAEVDAARQVKDYLDRQATSGALRLPKGATYWLDGSFRSEQKANQRLRILVPVALALIFLILYLQFRSATTAALIFTGVAVAFSGGFALLWLYGRSWFLDFDVFGASMRDLFQVHGVNLSTAIWVGFLALFGIATDDGVVMGTYLEQSFRRRRPDSVGEIRQAVVRAGTRRVRACLMTTATTILALLPVITSHGRGSDIMVPMAIPCFGGMAIEVLTMLVVPVLYCLVRERAHGHGALPLADAGAGGPDEQAQQR
ncbi:MAG TPA: efflux RND transporter permease subunit [Phycisphaerae bacterium]|nr:efflux RND transporter permease subunit [Phycisphaerae bacterium]